MNFRDDLETGYDSKFYAYWNDCELEKTKAWYVTEDNKEIQWRAAIDNAKKMGLYDDERALLSNVPKNGKGISLASGTCWDAGIIFEICRPECMDFLDFSTHRIFQIAPLMLEAFHVDGKAEINLIHGDYYHVNSQDSMYDFVTMSMSLMMAEYPDRLLGEVSRISRRGGAIVITGEPKLSKKGEMKATLRVLYRIFMSRIQGKEDILLQPWMQRKSFGCDISGANCYTLSGYKKMFRKAGLKLKKICDSNDMFWGFYLENEK